MKLFFFLARYITSVAANLIISLLGFLPKYRETCYEAAYRLGWRKRPPVDAGLPPLHVPAVTLSELVSNSAPVRIREPEAADGNVTEWELLVIAQLVANRRPDICFEIGTFDGRTTLNLAANMAPDGRVYTLDLPPELLDRTDMKIAPGDENFIVKTESGVRFRDAPESTRITQLWGDSGTFDFSPYAGRMDVVFVDGAHSYDYVMRDTDSALKLLKPQGGLILWHDYGSRYWKELTKALNEIHGRGGIFSGMRHVGKTCLVVLEVGSGKRDA